MEPLQRPVAVMQARQQEHQDVVVDAVAVEIHILAQFSAQDDSSLLGRARFLRKRVQD